MRARNVGTRGSSFQTRKMSYEHELCERQVCEHGKLIRVYLLL